MPLALGIGIGPPFTRLLAVLILGTAALKFNLASNSQYIGQVV
jgi:hypothetical protein